MLKWYKIICLAIFSLALFGCEIATRPIEEESDNESDEPIIIPSIPDEPKEPTLEEIRMWTDSLTWTPYREFYYNIALNYCDKDAYSLVEYRKDIQYSEKMHFGYTNKYIENCDKEYLPNHDNICVYISYQYNPHRNEWIKESEYASYPDRIQELNDLFDSYLEAATNGEMSIEEYDTKTSEIYNEIKELQGKMNYYLAPVEKEWFLTTYNLIENSYTDYSDANYGGAMFYYSKYRYDTIEQLNANLESLNELAKEDWIRGIGIIRDFGELLSTEAILKCAEPIFEYEAYHDEHFPGTVVKYFGSSIKTIQYYTYNIAFFDGEYWAESMYNYLNGKW